MIAAASYNIPRREILQAVRRGAANGVSEIATETQTGLAEILQREGGGGFAKPARRRVQRTTKTWGLVNGQATRINTPAHHWRLTGKGASRRAVYSRSMRLTKRRSRGYRRSVIGQPPAKQTGALLNSWRTRLDRPKMIGAAMTMKVVHDNRLAPYARALEYGYPARNLGPRPYFRPTVREVRPRARGIVMEQIASAMIRSGFMRHGYTEGGAK